jgi:hypothetical protein
VGHDELAVVEDVVALGPVLAAALERRAEDLTDRQQHPTGLSVRHGLGDEPDVPAVCLHLHPGHRLLLLETAGDRGWFASGSFKPVYR